MSFLRPVLFLGALLTGAACSPEDPGGAGGTGGAGGEEPCPTGSVAGLDGACLAVGIQRCPARFVEEDGLCHPSMAKCADRPGTIPRFGDPAYEGEGCEPVGIPDCAAELLDEEGFCRPSITKCPEGTFPVPQQGCVPIDGPDGCGEGTWGHIADVPGTVYVDGGTAAGGDGSKGSPAKTLAEAMDLVPAGGKIAIAAGVYDEPLQITKDGLVVEGRCPSMVRIQGTQPLGVFQGVVRVMGDGVTLRGVEIGGDGIGVSATSAQDLKIERVHVRGARWMGIDASGAKTRLWLVDSAVTGTTPRPDGNAGMGIQVAGGARATIERTTIAGNRDAAVLLLGSGVEAEIVDSLVEATAPVQIDGSRGAGVVTQESAKLTLSGSAVVANRMKGLHTSAGAVVTVSRSLVAGTLPQESDGLVGFGVSCQKGGAVTLEDSLLLENQGAAIHATGAGSTITARRNLVLRTEANDEPPSGKGVTANDGATVVLDANAIVESRVAGVHAIDGGTAIVATRNLVEGTLPSDADLLGGFGVAADLGAAVTLEANSVVGNHVAGLGLNGPGTEVTATANLVENSLPRPVSNDFGRGIDVDGGAKLTFLAGVVRANRESGLSARAPGTALTVMGSLIVENLPSAEDGQLGTGIAVNGAGLEISSCILRDNHVAAVLVVASPASISGTLVDGTLEGRFDLVNPMSTHDDVGDGILVARGSAVQVTATRVTRCPRAGILFDSSSGSLSGVVATGNGLGLVLQGSPVPEHEDGGNDFAGNSGQGIVLGGDLAVPDPLAPIPH